jgi:hypothetical protein
MHFDATHASGRQQRDGRGSSRTRVVQAGTIITNAIAAGGDAARLTGVSFAIEEDDALLAAVR